MNLFGLMRIFNAPGVFALALAALAGCWRKDTSLPPAPPIISPTAQQTPVETAVPKPPVLDLAPGHEDRQFDKPLRDELRQWDPAVSGWHTEKFAADAAAQLAKLAGLMCDGSAEEAQLKGVVDSSFSSAALRPEQKEAFKDARFTVTQSVSKGPWLAAAEFNGLSGFSKALEAMIKPLAGGKNIRAQFEIFAIEQKAGTATTQVRLRAAGDASQAGVQLNAVWKCQWNTMRKPPTITHIEVVRHEEVFALAPPGGLLADCTQAVLGQTDAWRRQIRYSTDHWRRRFDGALQPDLAGLEGLAIGDANGDGLEDVYLCFGAGLPNRLLLQNSDGTVRDASAEAGVDWMDASHSALFLDLDNDGDQDLVLDVDSTLVVMENVGQKKFIEAFSLPLEVRRVGSISAADYDGDGRTDIFICGQTPRAANDAELVLGLPAPLENARNGAPSRLLRNLPDWEFEDVTQRVGLGAPRFAAAAAWEDFDNDGDMDVYVSDMFGPGALFRNDDGEFSEAAPQWRTGGYGTAKGACWGDYNGDGWPDLFVGHTYSAAGLRITVQPNFTPAGGAKQLAALQRAARGSVLLAGDGSGGLRDVSELAGAAASGWAWGTKFVDLNGDGYDEIFVANGFVTGAAGSELDSVFWRRVALQSPVNAAALSQSPAYRQAWAALNQRLRRGSSWEGAQRNTCFLNLGGQAFADASGAVGFDFADDSRALAATDWDHDGDLDLWITNRNAPRVRLLCNQTAARYVQFVLQGAVCNRDAIGARVELHLKPSGRRLSRIVSAGEGYLSQSSKVVHFGLGEKESIERLVVRWPFGKRDEFSGLEPNRRYLVVQNAGRPAPLPARPKAALRPQPPELPQEPLAVRIPLVSRPPLPLMKYRDLKNETAELGGPVKTPQLVTIWGSRSQRSIQQLEALQRDSVDLRLAGVDVVALCVDQAQGLEVVPQAAVDVVAGLNFAFRTGVADESMINQFDALQRAMRDAEQPLPLPSSFLLDRHGRAAAIYLGPLELRHLLDDIKHLDDSEAELRARAAPLPGRWRAPPRSLNPSLVAAKLYEGGYREEALAYVEQLIAIGREQRTGYEQLSPRQLYYQLGSLQQELGRTLEAAQAFEFVLKLDPDNLNARRQLAAIASAHGRHEEAALQLAALVEAEPENLMLRLELAQQQAAAGFAAQAIAQYRRLLAARPDWQAPAHNLAWLLATHPDPRLRNPDEAMKLARTLCEATSYSDAAALDTLAAAFASAGRLSGAVSTARQALHAAQQRSAPAEQVEGIQQRLRQYQSGRPYFEDPKREAAPQPSPSS